MARPRFQNGSLTRMSHPKGDYWEGRYRLYAKVKGGGVKLSRVSKVLGRCSEVTESEARERLRDIVAKKSRTTYILAERRLGEGKLPFVETWTACQIGAAAELLVAADLTIRGYEVFRALSPGACCDLVAINGTETHRVEVKAAKIKDGKPNRNLKLHAGTHDIIAIVDSEKFSIDYRNPDGLPLPELRLRAGDRWVDINHVA